MQNVPSPEEPLVVDDREAGLFRVNRRSFTEAAILEQERRRIFARSWLYAGHESELPAPGDFRAREVGGRRIILVRGSDGKVRALFNTCRHRGALVCLHAAGNAKSFQCSYHGWTYGNDGELVGLPGADAYAPAFDRKSLALAPTARLETYRGFIFVSFAPRPDSLIEYLAGAREHLDIICDYVSSSGGTEIVGGTQLYCMRANWKLLVENSIDQYHLPTTHRRYIEFLSDAGVRREPKRPGAGHSLGNGHTVIHTDSTHTRTEEIAGGTRDYKITHTSRNLFVFPNLVVVLRPDERHGAVAGAPSNAGASITIRTFYPREPDNVDITAWALAPAGESAAARALRLDNFLVFFGPGGYATPDDVEMLESCQKGFANQEVGWSDISRGMKRDQPLPDDELQMRGFWRRWHALVAPKAAVHDGPET